MSTINQEILSLLTTTSDVLVGFADLRPLAKEVRQNFNYGVVIALPYSREAMDNSKIAPSQLHWEEYLAMGQRIPPILDEIADLLIQKQYKALALAKHNVVVNEDLRTVLPYKTVATLAGIGWIGKCAALITHKYGSAVRMGVVLTNAPLECGEPITESLCPAQCTVCVDVCPGHAVKGELWEVGIDRDELFDARACQKAASAMARPDAPPYTVFCGLCVANCPFTQGAKLPNLLR